MGVAKNRNRYGETRKALQRVKDGGEEAALKNSKNYGGKDYAPSRITHSAPRLHQHFGLVVVSCDHADLRPVPDGVMIYNDDEMSRSCSRSRDTARRGD